MGNAVQIVTEPEAAAIAPLMSADMGNLRLNDVFTVVVAGRSYQSPALRTRMQQYQPTNTAQHRPASPAMGTAIDRITEEVERPSVQVMR